MRISKLFHDKNVLLITYKLLHDALFILLISFFAILIIEGALPGLVSSHLSLVKISIGIIFFILGIVWIGNKLQITYDKFAISKNKLLPVLILLSILLIGNSLLRFAFWENMIITFVSLFIFSFILKAIFFSKK